MGRGKKKVDHARPGGPKWRKRDDRDKKSDFILEKTNPYFESYYKEQKILSEAEWDEFLTSLRASLPVTFRLTGSRTTAQDLNDLIKDTYIPHLSNVVFEGNAVPAPSQLPWYPDGLGWELKVQKSVIRKSPEFKKFQDFLVYETDVGNISRQEAVSMLPPLVLDVEPHHKVLDMCAAPGSKTAQLLDALHSGTSGADPTGVVIANDSDFRRAYMLVHQSARLHSTAMMVTNLDASSFPTLKLGSREAHNRRTLYFDRILCDVPCSGDGTLRKNMQIWNSWQPAVGNGLHALQLRILLRAMAMLAPNGRIVYSTCSLNPIENEAVLAAALNATPGQFQLVDISSRLPGLVRRPGLTNWRVGVDKEINFFDKYDDFQASLTTDRDRKERGSKIAESLFAPTSAAELHLDRSMRIYPHLQDTGGFFVAVLERIDSSVPALNPTVAEIRSNAPLKRTASNLSDIAAPKSDPKRVKTTEDKDAATPAGESAVASTDDNDDIDAEVPAAPVLDPVVATAGTDEAKVSAPPKKWKEAPYTFLPSDNRHLKSCLTKLHVAPDAFENRIFIRTADTDSPRAIYVCNALVRDVIDANDPQRMRLINCGVKTFTRQGNEGGRAAAAANAEANGEDRVPSMEEQDQPDAMVEDEVPTPAIESSASTTGKDLVFRFVYEGVEAVLPFVEQSSVLKAGIKELRRMLEVYYPSISDFDGSEFGTQMAATKGGAHLVRFEAGEYEGGILTKPTTLPIWISAKSLSLMTDKQTKSALCLRLYGEDFTPFGKELLAKKQASSRTGVANEPVADAGAESSLKIADDDDADSTQDVARKEG